MKLIVLALIFQFVMKQPVTQIVNNRKFGYFITLLKIKFLVSQLASK